MAVERVKFLNNKDLLVEIHNSKMSYCYYVDKEHTRYDAIVNNVVEITPELIAATKIERAAKLSFKAETIDPSSIATDELIFRVMTSEHIPDDPERKRKSRIPGREMQSQTNFNPFKHVIIMQNEDGSSELREVLRSHWRNGFNNGEFCADYGSINKRLAKMFLLLVDQYSKKGNWRNYTYNEDMRGQALVHLSQVGLQFNEAVGSNPFAWYTSVMNNDFRRILISEKKVQILRDDLLIMSGSMPSFTRQIEHEIDEKFGEHAPPNQSVQELRKTWTKRR